MNILYLHQYFKTPEEPGGTRSYWIARKLIEVGHKVTIITSENNLTGKKKEIKQIDGITVVYMSIPYSQSMGIMQRMKSFVDFMFRSTWCALKLKNIDLVIATSTPLTIGFPALILKFLKKIPYLFEVRDLWPEVPIQMGGLKNPLLKWMAKQFEKLIYKKSIHIVALSPGMADGVISCGIPPEKITTIPNMAKIEEFWPREKNIDRIRKMGLRVESFKLIHFGALGLANGADYIINAAKILASNDNLEFLFIGGGSTEDDLKKMCRENNLKNVHFSGKYSMKETSEIVNFCDASVVSFQNLPILYTNSPNKLFDSLSAGKPIIVNSPGWTKELVEKAQCGLYADPSDPVALADAILYLSNNPDTVEAMGKSSRVLAETVFDKAILCEKFADVVHGLNIKQGKQNV